MKSEGIDIVRERLAANQHDIWSHWMKYQLSVCIQNPDGSVTIPVDKVERWKRQTETKYFQLPESEKESDRHQADKVLGALASIKVPGNYVTRDGSKAYIWEEREVTEEVAPYFERFAVGDLYLIGTVEGGGMNCWFVNGEDASGDSCWDLLQLI